MEAFVVYMTAKDEDEARIIARTVVVERLAACANVLGRIESVYRWEGKMCNEAEAALILKTSAARREELIERIRELHSYECPCVVALPVADGNPEFLRWISAETAIDQ